MEWAEGKSGLVLPKEKPQPSPKLEPAPEVEPLRDFKGGHNPDGSFTLCPEAFAALQKAFLHLGGGSIRVEHLGHGKRLEQVAEEIWLHQGIGFERYC